MPITSPLKGRGTPPVDARTAGLLAREPCLRDAIGVESAIGRLYERRADQDASVHRRHLWLRAARLTRMFGALVERWADACTDLAHNPRPTRVRLKTMRSGDLYRLKAQVERLADDGAIGPIHELESRALLTRILSSLQMIRTAELPTALRLLALRKQVLTALDVPYPLDVPDSPPRRRQPSGRKVGARSPSGRTRTWIVEGSVERLDKPRRCGAARMEDGRLAFFPAQAVTGGLTGLQVGSMVTMTVCKGPLGLTAVQVQRQAAANA